MGGHRDSPVDQERRSRADAYRHASFDAWWERVLWGRCDVPEAVVALRLDRHLRVVIGQPPN